jgi:hypothetical protein
MSALSDVRKAHKRAVILILSLPCLNHYDPKINLLVLMFLLCNRAMYGGIDSYRHLHLFELDF